MQSVLLGIRNQTGGKYLQLLLELGFMKFWKPSKNWCRNCVQKVTKNVSDRDPKICKIELGDLRILCLISFCRSSFLNDSTTIFMVFHLMGVPWRQQIHRKRHVEAVSKKLPKMILKITENWSPNGVPKSPKSIKNDVLGSPLHKGGS